MILVQFSSGELEFFLSPRHFAKLHYLNIAIVSANYDVANQKL